MTPEEVETIARGLYYLASRDGIDPREVEMIREFLAEAGSDIQISDIESSKDDFDPREAAQVFETTNMRRVFLRAAIALVRADGTYSAGERAALGKFADAFGLSNTEYAELEHDASAANLA